MRALDCGVWMIVATRQEGKCFYDLCLQSRRERGMAPERILKPGATGASGQRVRWCRRDIHRPFCCFLLCKRRRRRVELTPPNHHPNKMAERRNQNVANALRLLPV